MHKTKRPLSFLLAVLMIVSMFAAVPFTVSAEGDGSESAPFLISSTEDWNAFAQAVNGGNDYAGKVVKLVSDIDVTTLVGNNRSHRFAGTFDGDGHTITANINDNSAQGTALFRSIAGATLRNLTLAGTVRSTQYHAAALFGFAETGTNLVENCVVTATVIGKSYAGGVCGHGLSSTVIVRNTVFSGLINVNGTLGVFQGWADSDRCTVENCLYIANSSQPTGNLSYVRNGTQTVTNCFKTGSTIDAQGTLAHAVTLEGEGFSLDIGEGTSFKNGLTAYANAIQFDGLIYMPDGSEVRVITEAPNAISEISVNNGAVNVAPNKDGIYSFKMPAANTVVRATVVPGFAITWLDEDGTVLGTNYVAEGQIPTHGNPLKESDEQHAYRFSGWTPEVVAVTGDATYTATYTEIDKHRHDELPQIVRTAQKNPSMTQYSRF